MGVEVAYGGLAIQDGGAQTQALTTTPGQVVAWSLAKGQVTEADSYSIDGDVAVRPDQANNRILLCGPPGPPITPGTQQQPYAAFRVWADLSVVGGGTADIIMQLAVNGVVRQGFSARSTVLATERRNLAFSTILRLLLSDNPKNVPTFADPANPPSVYGGAGGAPKILVPVTLVLSTVTGTVTVTIEGGHFNVEQRR